MEYIVLKNRAGFSWILTQGPAIVAQSRYAYTTRRECLARIWAHAQKKKYKAP